MRVVHKHLMVHDVDVSVSCIVAHRVCDTCTQCTIPHVRVHTCEAGDVIVVFTSAGDTC